MSSSWLAASLSAAGTCQCPSAAVSSTVVSTVHDAGRDLQRCLVCPAGTTADASTGSCVPPSGAEQSPAKDLAYVLSALNAKGAGILAATATQAVIQGVLESSGRERAYTIPQSWPLVTWLGSSARTCMDAGNREGCNAVANLCALQMYSTEAASCQVYDELLAAVPGSNATSRRASSSSSNAFPRPNTGSLPWLYYLPGSPYLSTADVDLQVSMAASSPPLRFVLSAYDINGTWLGLHNWTLQLQVCGGSTREASMWTRFGVDYSSSCSVDVSALLAQLDYSSNGPRFYDPYIMQDSGLLYPVPIKLLNKPDTFTSEDLPVGHVRRFFFIDTLLSRSTATGSDGATQAVVFLSQLSLLVQIQPDARNRIRPPLLTVKYSALSTSPEGPPAPATFSVTYTNPPELTGAFWYAWQTILIVLLILVGGPWWLWRITLYSRKKANAPMDLELLLYGLLAAVDVLSATLVLVLLMVSLYWLVLYKLQEGVLLMMLPDDQLYNFWVTVVLALVGQSVGLLTMLVQQISVDIFFLDWEKPRRVLAKGGGREEPGPISAWRTLLVANEWNELQTTRFTCPAFTLLAVVFVLQGANMQAAAYISPNQDDFSSYQNVQQSMLLRFAIAAVWFLIVGLAQVLWKVLLVHRFSGHPLDGFIDLLFLANTSAVILDERHSGYYLHGRNQMQHSDTTLAELNGSLLREGEGLVAARGLVATYTGAVSAAGGGLLASGPTATALNDNQVFLLHVSPELRRSYEFMLLSQIEQAAQEQRANKGVVTTAVRGPSRPKSSSIHTSGVYAEMFKSAVDEVERNHATQVIIPTYWQRLLRMPPAAAATTTLMQHDFHSGFASTLFFGQELRLYVYEALLFSGLHMSLGNAAVSGFITMIVQQLVVWVRQHWGENNLARKTLVDRHFLI